MEKIKSREGGREWPLKKKMTMTMTTTTMMMIGTLDEVFYQAPSVERERVVQHIVCLSVYCPAPPPR